jgi:HAMP domain-containing protein/serine phosphatase RsbU (regulator of sigma subunit)
MELIHYNFFTIGSIIATIFCFYIARLLLTIPDRSSASNHLGLAIFFLGLFHFFYLFAFSINHPIAVFFRWGAILFPMLAALEVGRFFINFKESNAKKKDRRFAYILYSIASLVLIYFIVTSIFATRIYYAQSHYFDFKLPQFYKIFSIIVFAYILIFILIGIFTYRRVSKEDKFTVIAILLSFVIITIIPGVLNALSRDGAVSRSTYQAWTDLLVVIGLFFVVIIYINNTDDKTTILSRITGISMATLMLVLQGIAFIAISNQENSYDRQKIQEARLATSSKQYSEEIRFITSYDIASSQFTNIYAKTQELPNAIEYKPEFLNSWIWFRISQINSNDSTTFRNSLDSILKNTHIEFAGYKALIDDYLKDNTGDQEKLNAKAMIQYFSGLERKIYYNRNKLTALDETGRAEWIEKKKEGEDWLGVFTRGLVAGNLGADRIVLGFLPFQSNSNRNYRGRLEFQKEEVTPEYFTSYFLFDETQSKVYEVGFSYSAYQKFIDEIGRIFTWIVVLTTLLIGFGYRYFFSGALIRPLGNVIEGLKQVNAGNLNVQLPIAVEDEIGFMARSFNSMVESISIGKKKLQEYAEQLEVKVEERTSELKHTLTEVQSLKSQQDGDYFLTSLLIKPLSSNHVDMENVSVEFFTKQKKTFSFRKYNEEIGGDISMASNIHLRGRKFAAFMNADAMGKSMQGAGGALVIGSVFESILERTKISKEAQNYFPERWLKNTFIELHKVFESFNGSMLISLVMGLVDETTGIVYFINAEHPFSILYRDGVASFIEQELMFRKLGTSGVQGIISIQTFEMKPNDSLIIGSDGRDDIVLGHNHDGSRIMNEDENLFLRVLEKSKGDLETSYKKLKELGEISDDLSLMKITWNPSNRDYTYEIPQEAKLFYSRGKDAWKKNQLESAIFELQKAVETSEREPALVKKLALMHLKARKFSIAQELLMEYIDGSPHDTEAIYLTSYTSRKAGDYLISIDLGERVRLRTPLYGENLLNLAKSHLLLKNIERAYSLLMDVKEILPGNGGVHKLIQFTERKIKKE